MTCVSATRNATGARMRRPAVRNCGGRRLICVPRRVSSEGEREAPENGEVNETDTAGRVAGRTGVTYLR